MSGSCMIIIGLSKGSKRVSSRKCITIKTKLQISIVCASVELNVEKLRKMQP